MLSPLRQWNAGEKGYTKGPDQFLNLKSDSTTCSSEDSLNVHKPLLKTTAHFQFPPSILCQNDLGTTIDDDNKENVDNCHSSINEGSSEEIFKIEPKRNVLSDTYNKQIIESAFAHYDPFAKLPCPVTPKPATPESILLSPNTPASGLRDRYISNEAKTALRRAAIEGQQDFIRILKKNGIDPEVHFASLSSKKKSNKKVNFECSTPKAYSAVDYCPTPSEKSYLNDTPLSGFKQLASDLNLYDNSPFIFNASAASSPHSSCPSDVSLHEPFSPDKDLTPEIKSTLLSGIVCYVDCRSDNENRTESVQSELISLGAKVEKNFTKKVTHVVFKEGRMSTYIKAKKENIPLVGVLWIEACKKVRGIADPALYRPKKMQKYDRLLPFQMITKRRLAILNPNSRVRRNLMVLCGETPPPLPERRKRSRKAVTDVKGLGKHVADQPENRERNCTKKLFSNETNNDNSPVVILDGDVVDDFTSTDNSDLLKEAVRLKRKSAPGKLLSKKSAKMADIKDYFRKVDPKVNKHSDNDENDISLCRNKLEMLVTNDKQVCDEIAISSLVTGKDLSQPTQERKRRKLFNPNEEFSFSQRSESESTVTDISYPSTPKRVRTKATCGGRPMKLAVSHKLLAKKNDKTNNDSSPSVQWFVNHPVSCTQNFKQLKQPSISFTSIPKSELPKYIDIVKKLGKFDVDEKVTKNTTHLVSNGPRRTINLIKGIARGCWLIDIKWAIESDSAGKWLPPEDYNLFATYPAAAECCAVRRSLKTTRVIEIFRGVGKIFVSRKLRGSPHFTDVEELLRICAADVVTSPQEADIIVGSKGKKSSTAICVSSKWVLDSVTGNLLLPIQDFLENEPLSQGSQEK